MTFSIPSNGLPFSLVVGIKAPKPEEICIEAKDAYKPNSFYISRKGEIKNGYRVFELKFPQSPKLMQISIFNKANGNYPTVEDNSLDVAKLEQDRIKTQADNALKMAQFQEVVRATRVKEKQKDEEIAIKKKQANKPVKTSK